MIILAFPLVGGGPGVGGKMGKHTTFDSVWNMMVHIVILNA